jgi:hypothetical protein
LLNEHGAERGYGHNNFIRWMARRLHASRYPLLAMAGWEVDLRMGVTSSMVKEVRHECRVALCSDTAAGYVFSGAGRCAPHTPGAAWERPGWKKCIAHSVIYIVPTGAICHTCYTEGWNTIFIIPRDYSRCRVHTQAEWAIGDHGTTPFVRIGPRNVTWRVSVCTWNGARPAAAPCALMMR